MRNGLKNIVTFLLTFWYLFSIVGFSSHACAATGESFILSLLEDTSCSSVHPEHDCGEHSHAHQDCSHGCCGHSSDCTGSVQLSENCCTNNLHIITLTGDRSGDDDKLNIAAPANILARAAVHDCGYCHIHHCLSRIWDEFYDPADARGSECELPYLYCAIRS